MPRIERSDELVLCVLVFLLVIFGGPTASADEFEARSIDGTGNNLQYPSMGAAHTPLMRQMDSHYGDGVSQMNGSERPNPRVISNIVSDQSEPILNSDGLSSFFWLWGQFIDHDIDLTESATPSEPANIPIPMGDPWFDPGSTGTGVMQFSRSEYSIESGTGTENPREQMNGISSWIDASMVYGSDPIRAAALRTNDGTGRLKTSDGRLPPWNDYGLPNAGGSGNNLFLAGDVRANEHVGLTAMHTLFVREHNRLARIIRSIVPHFSGDMIYERARNIVAAEVQIITYKEFLPALLGRDALPRRFEYRPEDVGAIRNSFSTAAFRLGHSLLPDTLLRVDKRGREMPAGNLPLAEAFFAPHEITDHGIDGILRGMALNPSQQIDVYITSAVRSFLFGPPPNGFDLASLNIQRGRDHGLPAYNEARVYLGLEPAATFADISSDAVVQQNLALAYPSPDYVDIWVGGLAEDHYGDAVVGELFYTLLHLQFTSLAHGDRFFYERSLSFFDWILMGDPRLGSIIRRNTGIGAELSSNVFKIRKPR